MADEDDSREARARMIGGALRGLARAAEDLLGEAARNAPVDEGTLRASGTVVLLVNGSRYEGAGALAAATAAAQAAARRGLPVTLDAEVSFNTVYAARQHEELSWNHPLGGGPKYLERPLLERSGRYADVIERAARAAL